MDNFTFYSPTLFAFGDGQAQTTGSLVRRFGGSKVLLVYGGGSVKRNGAYDAVTASLKEAGIPFQELSGIQANPRSGKVYEGIETVRKEGLDFLVALGGGSVIDTAKAIGMGAEYDGDFWDFFSGKTKIERSLPVGVILTIAAAGSEGSDSCVITHENGNLKWGIPKSDAVRPKFSVLDPRYTCSLPPYQTACGAYLRAVFLQHPGCGPHGPALRSSFENRRGRRPQGHCRRERLRRPRRPHVGRNAGA